MKAAKTLGRPANWQDFESLCKKLWGEIWECPEIKKNGRSGQDQSGVDVYGIPKNEEGYYGIQCKGKDEYTNKQLSEAEIKLEIEKAKKFIPKLKKFYFSTTAVKDTKIEAVIRNKNIEHKKIGLFEVHLFSWDDIVDLIFENQETHDYYVNSLNFKTIKSIELTFHDNSKEITVVPKFQKEITYFNLKEIPVNPIFDFLTFQQKIIPKITTSPLYSTKINYSYCKFYLKLQNTGTLPLEDYKILLEFEGKIQDLSNTNEISTGLMVNINNYIPNISLDAKEMTGMIVPKKNILVGDDILKSENIFLKPFANESKVIIRWKLLSKNFKDHGELILDIKPEIVRNYKTVIVGDSHSQRLVEGVIEDYIAEKTEK